MNKHRTIVLACIDGSTFSAAVVDYAAWAAGTLAAPLTLLHHIEHRVTPIPDLSGNIGLGAREELLEELIHLEERRSKIMLQQGELMLKEAWGRAAAAGVDQLVSMQRHGALSESLIEMENEVRLLVLGIRGEDSEDRQRSIGAQLETVIRALHRPVLVVNTPFVEPPKRIMIAYDDSEAARKGVDMVVSSPLFTGISCHLVHVAKAGDDGAALLEKAAERLRGAGLTTTVASINGDFEKALTRYQEEHQIQMIVMGAFGHGRLRELLFGSRTAKMLAASNIPLLLLR